LSDQIVVTGFAAAVTAAFGCGVAFTASGRAVIFPASGRSVLFALRRHEPALHVF
jgi:hypothetical protein